MGWGKSDVDLLYVDITMGVVRLAGRVSATVSDMLLKMRVSATVIVLILLHFYVDLGLC